MELSSIDLLILKSETIEKIKDIQYRFGLLSSEFILSTDSEVIENNVGHNVYIAKQITVLTQSVDNEYKNLNYYQKQIKEIKQC